MSEVSEFTNWLTKEQVAAMLRVSSKSVERYATAGKLQRKYAPKEGQRPMPLFNPDDVSRLNDHLYGAAPMVLRSTDAVGTTELAPRRPNPAGRPIGELALRLLEKALDRTNADSPIWMTLRDAARVSGLPRRYLEAAITKGALPAHNISRSAQRRWRVRRADLEGLAPSLSAE